MYDFSNWNLPSLGVDVNQMTNKVAMYLLKVTLGKFVVFPEQNEKETLNPDFEMALKSGKLTLRRLKLNIKNINEQLIDSPFEVNKGSIDSIDITVPWFSIYSEPCQIQVKGLELEISPKAKSSNATQSSSEKDSQYKPKLNSSQVIAKEFLNEEYDNIYEADSTPDSQIPKNEGIPLVSSLIEKLIANLKFSISDLRLIVNQPSESKIQGTSQKKADFNKLSIDLDLINCLNEIPGEDITERDNGAIFKVFSFQGFRIKLHQHQRNPVTLLEFSVPEESLIKVNYTRANGGININESSNSTSADGNSFVNDAKVSIQANFQKARLVLTPGQFKILHDFAKAISCLLESDNSTDPPTTQGLGVYFGDSGPSEVFPTNSFIQLPQSLVNSTIDWQVKVEELDFKILYDASLSGEISEYYPQCSHIRLSLKCLECDGVLVSTCPDNGQLNQNLQAEVNLSSIVLDEWLASTQTEISAMPPDSFTSQQDVYIPILMADLDLPNSTYLFEKFKLFSNGETVKLEPRIFTGLNSFWSDCNDRFERDSNNTEGTSVNSGLDEFLAIPEHDVHVNLKLGQVNQVDAEVRPMCLRVDVRLIDRFKKYIEPLMEAEPFHTESYPVTKTPEPSPYLTRKFSLYENRFNSPREGLESSATLENLILQDLDQHNQKFNHNGYSEANYFGFKANETGSWTIRLATSFLRIVILTPCGILDGAENEEPNNQSFARVHHNFWIMDIKDPTLIYPEASLPSNKEVDFKLKVQYKGLDISLFLGLEGQVHTFLTLGQGSTPQFKDETLAIPGLTVQMNSLATEGLKRFFAPKNGTTLPVPFPATFKGFKEGDVTFTSEESGRDVKDLELVHQLQFQNDVVDTSKFVIHCEFPKVNIRFNKRLYDLNQFLVNDISSWEPTFTKAKVESDPFLNKSFMNRSDTASFYTAKDYSERNTFSKLEPKAPFIGRATGRESLKATTGAPENLHTLLSLVVDMPHLDIQLDFDGGLERHHTISMTQCSFFSATKLQGLAQNYVTVNTEMLYLSSSITKTHKPEADAPEASLPDKVYIVSPTPAQRPSSKGCFSVTLFSKLEEASSQLIKDIHLALEIRGLDLVPPLDKQSKDSPLWLEDLACFGSGDADVKTVSATLLRSRVQVHLKDLSLVVDPPNHPSQLVVLLENLKVATTVFAPDPVVSVLIGVARAKLLLSKEQDLERVIPSLALGLSSAQFTGSGCWDEAFTVPQYWESNGFANIGTLQYLTCDLDVVLREPDPLIVVDILGEGPRLELCKDSLATLKDFIDHLVAQPKPDQTDADEDVVPPTNKLGTLDQSIHYNILDDIEEQAFGVPMLLPTPNPSRKHSSGDGIVRSHTSQFGVDFYDDFYASSPSIASPRGRKNSSNNGDESDWLHEFSSPEEYGVNFNGMYEGAMYTDTEPIQFIENYFTPFDETDSTHRWRNLENCALRLRTLDVSFHLKLYSGNEWSAHPYASPHTSPLSGLPHLNANLTRPTGSSMELQVTKLNLTYTKYLPQAGEKVSDFQLDLGKLEVLDQLPTSTWRKFLTLDEVSSHAIPLDSSLPMIQFHLAQIAPKAMDSLEYQLKLEVLPIRLYVDQDALTFLTDFFTLPTDSLPNSEPEVSDNPAPVPEPVYFRYAEIGSLQVKVDYKPKHLNLNQLKEGHLAELANLFHLEDAQLQLKPVKFNGVDGVPKLLSKLTEAYLPHITSTQIPNVVAGVGPMRSLVNLGSGVADLILLPIQYYRRDGHLIRGLQKGAASFARSATSEAIRVGASLAMGANNLLEQADTHLRSPPTSTSFPPPPDRPNEPSGALSKYAQQPLNLSQGVATALGSLRRNLATRPTPLYAIPVEVQEPTASGKVRSVVKALPIALLQPMLLSTEVVATTLIGTLNWLDPTHYLQAQQKYKPRRK